MKKLLLLFQLTLFVGAMNAASGSDGPMHPKIKWRFKTQGPIRGASVVHQEKIYFGSADGFLYALDKYTGDLVWKYQTNGAITASPAVADSSVYFTSRDNLVYSLNANTGAINWKFEMNPTLPAPYAEWEYFAASPVLAEDKLLVGSGDGNLYALDAQSGSVLWKFKTRERIRASPLVDKDIIYQPSNDGFVYAIDVKKGRRLWQFETKGATYDSKEFGFDRNSIYTQPLIKNNLLIFGSRDGNVYAVDLKTKQQKWNFTYGTTWAMSTSLSDNTVFVGWSTNDLTSAIDLNTGLEKWAFNSNAHVYTKPLVVDSALYIGTGHGKIYRLDKYTGEKTWEYHIGEDVYSSLIYDSNTLFFGSDNGYFYALEEGEESYKAVYMPSQIIGNAKYLVVDPNIAPYLKESGFEQLDSAQLFRFITNRIEDKKPSVVVFAFPLIPQNIIGSRPAKGMVRQYLEAGGKIVWMGDIPNYFEANGYGFSRNPVPGTQLLDVKFPQPNESGNYYSKATQEGMNWGLPPWLKTTSCTVAPEGVIPFAHDEYGRVSLWMKKFNPRPGSGFISARTWAWNVPIQEKDLQLIYQLAIHELE